MNIVFVDAACPKPYDNAVLAASGLGGTEATVVRIATALSSAHDIVVCQHNRTESSVESPTLRFAPIADARDAVGSAAHVVFVKKAQGLGALAPVTRARLWLWLHNYLVDELPFHWKDHLRADLGVICVSRTHAEHTRALMGRHLANRLTVGYFARAGVLFHYNPIDEALTPDTTIVRDPDKLVFFSSPHKGVEQVLARFAEVHAMRPRLRLYVADPGYLRSVRPEAEEHPGIVRLGSIPHGEVARHVREALCVFYPQYKRPETFGLVYAESNAVGTPVLAHDFGSAREVLAASNQPFDTRDAAAVKKRLFEWIDHEPPVSGPDPRFRQARVVDHWIRFFEEPDRYAREQRTAAESGRRV